MLISGSIVNLHAGDFRVIALSTIDKSNSLEYQAPDGVTKVTISTLGFSRPYLAPESGVVDLYDKMPIKGEEKTPLVSLKMPEDGADVIVLLHVNRSNEYEYLLIEDSSDDFPSGSVLVLNFSKKSIFAKFGEERLAVPSGESRVVELARDGQEPFKAGVKFAAEFDGYGKVFSSSSWYLLPSMKIFCVVLSDKNGNPQIRRIRLT